MTIDFDVGDLEESVKAVETLRGQLLFDGALDALPPITEQHYLLALSALEQAQRHLTLALYWFRRKE
jgi:hypothetical protein